MNNNEEPNWDDVDKNDLDDLLQELEEDDLIERTGNVLPPQPDGRPNIEYRLTTKGETYRVTIQ
jgi:DNA-binding HxlR family transcriptional regulator